LHLPVPSPCVAPLLHPTLRPWPCPCYASHWRCPSSATPSPGALLPALHLFHHAGCSRPWCSLPLGYPHVRHVGVAPAMATLPLHPRC
jgi:hypothetical protein